MAVRLLTDSTCDLPLSYIKEHDITVFPFPIYFGDEEFMVGPDENAEGNIKISEFFRRIGEDERASTAQVPMDVYASVFEQIVSAGDDIVYIAFSSGCTGTVNSARLVASEIMEKYPGRDIRVVDSLCESLGEGMLVTLCADKLEKDAPTAAELAAYADDVKMHIHHWFTVNDLMYLAKGGRLSNSSAILGSMLNIKPVLDDSVEGKLVNREKVQGRKKSIRALLDKYMTLCNDKEHSPLYIGHGNCEEDALSLARMIEEKCGVKTQIINTITPVISAHCGIGTVAIFFLSDTPRGN